MRRAAARRAGPNPERNPGMNFLFLDTLIGWIEPLLAVIGAASAVAAATPTQKDDKIVGKIVRIVDFLALNVGNIRRR